MTLSYIHSITCGVHIFFQTTQYCKQLHHQHTAGELCLHNILWNDKHVLHVMSTTVTSGHRIIFMLFINLGTKSTSLASVFKLEWLGTLLLVPICYLTD